MKQRFCRVCGKLLTTKEHGNLCWKHYIQYKKYNKFMDSNPRTINSPNEFRFIGDKVEMDTFDIFGNTNYTYIIDASDYPEISKHKWCTVLYHGKPYAMEGKSRVKLYRFIMNPKAGTLIDHIDGNTLNNCKSNLRVANKSLNNVNLLKDGLKHKGVYQKSSGTWYASVQWKNKTYCSNTFKTKAEACFARYILEQMFIPHTIIQCNIQEISTLTQEQKDYVINCLNKKFQ